MYICMSGCVPYDYKLFQILEQQHLLHDIDYHDDDDDDDFPIEWWKIKIIFILNLFSNLKVRIKK